MASKYTREDLRAIFEQRAIDIDPKALKKRLSDGFTKYNHLVRTLLDTMFSHLCGDLFTNADATVLRINSIKQEIAELFGPGALGKLEHHLSLLEKQVADYTLLLELMKYYRKEIPMVVRECTQAKMTQRVINAITKFEDALELPPYPKTEAISRIKQACGPLPKDPAVVHSEKQSLKKFMNKNRYYPSIEKYIN